MFRCYYVTLHKYIVQNFNNDVNLLNLYANNDNHLRKNWTFMKIYVFVVIKTIVSEL